MVLLVPLVTMRQFAEERRAGTLELLLTAPVRESDIVLAKFVASMAVLLAMIALTGAYALILGSFGNPDWGRSTAATSAWCCWPARWWRSVLPSPPSPPTRSSPPSSRSGCSACSGRSIPGRAAAGADRQLGARPVAAGALHPLRGGRHVRLRPRLLRHRHPAGPVPRGAGPGAALIRWSMRDSTGLRCCGSPDGWPRCSASMRPRCGCRWRPGWRPGRIRAYAAGIVVLGVGVAVLANVALDPARRAFRPDAGEDLHAVRHRAAGGGRSSPSPVLDRLLLPLAGRRGRRRARPALVMARRNPQPAGHHDRSRP